MPSTSLFSTMRRKRTTCLPSIAHAVRLRAAWGTARPALRGAAVASRRARPWRCRARRRTMPGFAFSSARFSRAAFASSKRSAAALAWPMMSACVASVGEQRVVVDARVVEQQRGAGDEQRGGRRGEHHQHEPPAYRARARAGPRAAACPRAAARRLSTAVARSIRSQGTGLLKR